MNGDSCCTPNRPAVGKDLSDADRTTVARFERIHMGGVEGMKLIPAGDFIMGSADADGWIGDGEGPVRRTTLQAFHVDVCCVTNEQFNDFVNATGYKTEAERFGWSFVFHLFLNQEQLSKVTQRVVGSDWWCKVEGAGWRHPEGSGSNIKQRWDHPVVHVSWTDAMSYATWIGKRLPTEAEWECAARGGLVQKRYAWGDEFMPDVRHCCNIWQGVFPTYNSEDDGYAGTAPVRSFKANGYGLYNVAGNVWEWCHDWFSADYHGTGPRVDPIGPPTGDRKVVRGGSYLCHDSYCNRYRVGARTANTPDSSTGNIGFRCVRDV